MKNLRILDIVNVDDSGYLTAICAILWQNWVKMPAKKRKFPFFKKKRTKKRGYHVKKEISVAYVIIEGKYI